MQRRHLAQSSQSLPTGGIAPRPFRIDPLERFLVSSSALPTRRGPMSPSPARPWHFAQAPW